MFGFDALQQRHAADGGDAEVGQDEVHLLGLHLLECLLGRLRLQDSQPHGLGHGLTHIACGGVVFHYQEDGICLAVG